MKFRYLDGLRGLAALVVVVDHFAIAFFQRSTDASIGFRHTEWEEIVLQTPLHLLVSGNFSVCLFFVISGFVLSIKFFQTRRRSVVVSSAWRRYARLEIPVLASVILSYFVITLPLLYNQAAAVITGSTWLRDLWNFTPTVTDALYHATLGVYIEGQSQYNTVLWTMQMELLGSLVAFVFLLTIGRWKNRWPAYIALGVAFINSYLLCFIAGMAICDWYFNHRGKAVLQKKVWVPVAIVSLLLGSIPVGMLQGTVWGVLPEWLGHGLDIPYRMHIFGAIGLVFVVMATPFLQQVFNGRVLGYVGRISFGLYLTHLLVIGTFSSWLFTVVQPILGYLPGFIVVFGLSLLLIWLVAHVFSRWVDEPAIRFSNMLYERYFPKRWKSKFKTAEPSVQTVP